MEIENFWFSAHNVQRALIIQMIRLKKRFELAVTKHNCLFLCVIKFNEVACTAA